MYLEQNTDTKFSKSLIHKYNTHTFNKLNHLAFVLRVNCVHFVLKTQACFVFLMSEPLLYYFINIIKIDLRNT